MYLQIKKTIQLPNRYNLARFERCPELGPKVLFFSGGTALRNSCSALVRYTHNSIHIITPFDSGGSSAVLRKAFDMPAIGDIRNRLLALADHSVKGFPEIYNLFNFRFPQEARQEDLKKELELMISGQHSMVKSIPDPMRKIIRQHLDFFNKKRPEDFDLKKTSIGNLILTAGYLQNRRNFDVIIYTFSSLVRVRGIVRPVVNKCLDLAVELEDGDTIVSQHLFSGKEAPPLNSKIQTMGLSQNPLAYEPVTVPIRDKMKKLIHTAELICYPMGSYYSSILANLLPKGVGTAVKRNPSPKLMIPNTTDDPETVGMSLEDQVDTLLTYLRKDNPDKIAPSDVLNFVLLDQKKSLYKGRINASRFKRHGISIVHCPLVSKTSQPLIDSQRFVESILSFI